MTRNRQLNIINRYREAIRRERLESSRLRRDIGHLLKLKIRPSENDPDVVKKVAKIAQRYGAGGRSAYNAAVSHGDRERQPDANKS